MGQYAVFNNQEADHVKKAVQTAKKYVAELYADEPAKHIGVEEVVFDERDNAWKVTVGFFRPWDEKLGLCDTLTLYDVSSGYLEGTCCPLAASGHNRDDKTGKKRIVFGMLCASDDCPVAVEVFSGNTADPSTVASQVNRIRKRFASTLDVNSHKSASPSLAGTLPVNEVRLPA